MSELISVIINLHFSEIEAWAPSIITSFTYVHIPRNISFDM